MKLRRHRTGPIILSLLLVATATAFAQTTDDPAAPQLLQAQQLILQGQTAEARALLEKTSRQFPQDPRSYNLLGVISAQNGDYGSAEKQFMQAIQLLPRFSGARLNLGRLYQENLARDPEAIAKGIAVYKGLLSYEPGNSEALFQLALLYHLNGDYQASNETLARLSPPDQARAQSRAIRFGNLSALGKTEEAGQIGRELAVDPDLAEADVTVVLPAALKSGQDVLVIDLLRHLSDRGRLSIPTSEQLALLLADRGESKQALAILEGLASRHPNLPELLLKMAWIAYQANEYEGALGYLAHARDLNPGDPRVHYLFGLTCVRLGLGAEAVKSLEKAVELAPEVPQYLYALGTANLQYKDVKDAIPYLEKHNQLNPRDPYGKGALAEAHFLKSQYQAARKEFEELLQFPETAASANYYLGVIAKLDGRYEDALAYLSKTLELVPGNPDALAELGFIHTRQRDFEGAERVLDEALKVDRNHYQANFNLLTLYSRTRDERYEQQKQFFEEVKATRWEQYTNALRTIEVVPHYMKSVFWQDSSPVPSP